MIKKTLFVILLVTVSTLLIAELLLRAFAPSHKHLDIYTQKDAYFCFKANQDRVYSQSEFSHPVHTNSLGFRMKNEVDKNKRQIVMLGDSACFGSGVTDSETYSAFLQKTLDANGYYGYQVINAGIPGHGTIDQYNFLKDLVKICNVDVVVLQYNESDILEDFYHPVYMVEKGRLVFYRNEKNNLKTAMLNFLAQHSELANYIFYSFIIRSPLVKFLYKTTGQNYFQVTQKGNNLRFFRKEYDDLTNKMLAKSEESLKDLVNVSMINNIKLFIMYYPIPDEIKEEHFMHTVKAYNYNFEDFNRGKLASRMKEYALTNSIDFIDLFEELSKYVDENLFYEVDEHLTVHGNQVVANEIYKAMFKYLAKNRRY